MRILIIGSGLIGVTTAFCLRRAGYEVTVIDREESAGRGTSFANGALLTPSMAEPWNAPDSWRILLLSLCGQDVSLRVNWRTLPTLFGWGITFLRNCSPAAFHRNALSNLHLALYSLNGMETLLKQTRIEFGRQTRGSLRIFRDEANMDRAVTVARQRSPMGLGSNVLSPPDAVALEPALEPIARQLTGAIHYPADQVGDAYRFCVALADYTQREGVHYEFQTEILSLRQRSGKVTSVETSRGDLQADQYVVAAGSYSTPLLKQLGINLPVRPVKGYSATFACGLGAEHLGIPIVDDDLHAVVVPLPGAIRVAGTAEFAGYNQDMDPMRIRNLTKLLRTVLPRMRINFDAGELWCGLRAVSADGVPIIGATSISNVLVNTGHGHLGWTMAVGSAELLTNLLCGEMPSIDPAPYSLARFSALAVA
jgi:D-amino-acid dehydrogenase